MSVCAPISDRRRAWARAAVIALALVAWPGVGRAAEPPARVVSVNLCTDQLLVLLADPGQIAAISFLAADPALSYVAGRIAGFRLTYGAPEEVMALAPDLVLAGSYGAQPAIRLLRAEGVPVLTLDLAADWPAIAAQTRAVAAALGHPDRGERLVGAMEQELAEARPPPGAPRPSALFYQANGFTSGAGTLADLVLSSAGYRNFAAEAGLAGYGFLPLETIVAGRPDLLILDRDPAAAPSLADALLSHPALRRVRAGRPQVAVPPWTTGCGGPYTAEAVLALARARPRVAAAP